jgi:OmpA-OmpF porin, OOP family
MNRAKSLAATAVLAAFGALPLAANSQTAGAATGTEGGTTRYDTTPAPTTPGAQGNAAAADTTTTGVPGAPLVPGTPGASGTVAPGTDTVGTTGTTGTTPGGTTGATATGTTTGTTPDAPAAAGTRTDVPATGPTYGPTGAVGATDATGTAGATGTTGFTTTARDREAGILGQQQQPGRGLVPGTTAGYAGANLGWTRWSTPCVGGFPCDRSSVGGKIYTGGMFTNTFGAELGYIHMGNVDRGGGKDRAHGVNLSVVGNLPFDRFNAFGKVGTTYGFTRTNFAPASGLPSGKRNGFGLSYGLGVGMNLTNTTQLVAEWERHNFRFRTGRDSVHMFSIGARVLF